MAFPGWLCPWVEQRFGLSGLTGYEPNSLGFVETRKTNLTDPKATFSDWDLSTANENPTPLDADGRPTSGAIYLEPSEAYSFYVYDADMNLLYSVPFVSSAYLFESTSANIQTEGTTATSSPYTVQATDNTVTVDSSDDPFIVQLQDAAERGTPLIVKSISAVEVRVTPDGAQTIDDVAAYVALPAAGAPPKPAMTLLSDGTSNYVISATVGL